VDNLREITEWVRKSLSEKDEAREKMLPLCRESIRNSGNAIRAVHRQEFDEAKKLVKTAGKSLREAEEVVSTQPELSNTGMIRDAQKEFTEANVVLALVTGYLLPNPNELGVDAAPYLNGLGEAAGELRRYLLDSMRKGELTRGEEIIGAMDDIYGLLVTIDYPDAITGGLRRTTDMVRGVLERTRSDLTLTTRQMEFEKKLEKFVPVSEVLEKSSKESTATTGKGKMELERNEQEIYNALDAWRSKRSSEEQLAPYIIVRNSWLKEIIKMKPTSPRELMAIKGFGERRANKYGKDIIRVLKKGR
jgi:translin